MTSQIDLARTNRTMAVLLLGAATMAFLSDSRLLAQGHGEAAKPQAPPAAQAPAAPVPQATKPTAPPSTEPAKNLPAAKDVIAGAFEAMGGKPAVGAVKTVSVKASLETPMGQVGFDIKSSSDGKFRLIQSVAGQGEFTIACDGKTGWMNNPFAGIQILEDDQLTEVRSQINMLSYWNHLRPDDLYKSIKTVDLKPFHDDPTYRVEFLTTEDSKNPLVGAFSVEKKFMTGMIMRQPAGGDEQELDFQFGDWKKVGDLTVFHKVMLPGAMGPSAEIVYSEVAFNGVEASMFDMPADVKEALAKKNAPPASQPDAPPATAPTSQPGGH